MPVNGASAGRDVTLTIITPNGPLTIGLLNNFRCKQESTEENATAIDGVTRHRRFFKGWTGSFEADRVDSTLDDYFALLERGYYAGVSEPPNSITQTIQEPNGAISQYRFFGVQLKYDNAGDWAGDKIVKQSLSFVASRREKIA